MTNAIRLCCTYILSENVPMNTNRSRPWFFYQNIVIVSVATV